MRGAGDVPRRSIFECFLRRGFLVDPPLLRALCTSQGGENGSENLRAVGKTFLPIITAALTAGIFIADTITDLEIALPAFYTAIVLLSVGFCKKNGIVFVGVGCIALTLLSDLLTANTGVSETGVINTAISLLAITSTTFLAVKIQAAKVTALKHARNSHMLCA